MVLPTQSIADLTVRYTEPSDAYALREWLGDQDGGNGFPIDGELELSDAVIRWLSFCRYQCSITILKENKPCGIATLYLQPYGKLSHQCEFGIIVDKKYRSQRVGSYLLSCLIHLAKEKFAIEVLHLQVYASNPAMRFYRRFGFKEFGRQEAWAKEGKELQARVLMEKFL